MCHSSPIQTLNESSAISSGRLNSDRNGGFRKTISSKMEDPESSLPQKLRRMESSETQMSAQKSGITASSQNKSYNQPEQPESNLKTSKALQTNNSDRKTTSVNNMHNRQTKEDRGNYKP